MLLSFDDDNRSKMMEFPSWKDLESAIRSMNGTSRSEVGLFVDDDTYLQIGGGGNDFVCSIRAKGKLFILNDPKRSSTEMKWIIVGQGSDYPVNECFPVDVTIDVAKWFWENKTPSPEHHWTSL